MVNSTHQKESHQKHATNQQNTNNQRQKDKLDQVSDSWPCNLESGRTAKYGRLDMTFEDMCQHLVQSQFTSDAFQGGPDQGGPDSYLFKWDTSRAKELVRVFGHIRARGQYARGGLELGFNPNPQLWGSRGVKYKLGELPLHNGHVSSHGFHTDVSLTRQSWLKT